MFSTAAVSDSILAVLWLLAMVAILGRSSAIVFGVAGVAVRSGGTVDSLACFSELLLP
jgi:hypothetical protein